METTWRAFSGPTQLVGMAIEGVEAKRVLVALPVDTGLAGFLADRFEVVDVLHHDYAAYRHDSQLPASRDSDSVTLHFGPAWPEDDGLHDLGIIYIPKGKALIEHVFAGVSRAIRPGGHVMVVGPKKSGIRSSDGLIRKYFGEELSSRAARHSVLIETTRHADEAGPFTGERTYEAEAFGRTFPVVTLPGVFSYERLDMGTAFLLAQVDPAAGASVLDCGCGAGVIGAAFKLADPDRPVHMVDSNVMAVAAAARTLERNGLAADCVWASDVFSDVGESYDLIVSNPPFHAGLSTDFGVTRSIIDHAPSRLTRNGRLVMVCNTFINYFHALEGAFRDVQVLGKDTRFQVIQARNPSRR